MDAFKNALTVENQKIKIECIKSKDTCTIQKSAEPKYIQFKNSTLTWVEKKYVSRGCYDIKFVFGDENNYQRLYGAGKCSENISRLNFVINEFTNYIKNGDEYLLVKIGDEFYLSFNSCLLPLFILFFLYLLFVLPKRQELYLNFKSYTLVIYSYNLFNFCLKRLIALSDVDEFFVDTLHLGLYHVCCKNKNGKIYFILWNMYKKDNPDMLCSDLNKILNLCDIH